MGRKYNHLSCEERAALMLGLREGKRASVLAKLLGRSPSTISREIRRGLLVPVDATEALAPLYSASAGATEHRRRRERCGRKPKLIEGTPLYTDVLDGVLHKRWSPQQVSAKLKAKYPDQPERCVSHETIYRTIYAHPRGALREGMVAALRQRKTKRGRPRSTLARGYAVPEEMRIANRPAEVESRAVPGHWEGDFIKGAMNRSAVGTLVERTTRFVVLCKMDGCTAQDAVEGFTRQMKKIPAFLRESLTYDRGSEMAKHGLLSEQLKLDIYFADPYAPWQRGSNENTNGLLRQFLPKGIDLSTVTQTELNDIARLLNERPRETLGWDTPAERLAKIIQQNSNRVALDS